MENKPAFDRSLLIPIFIGFASVMGICLVLFAARFSALRGAIQADETRTPVKYQYVATEPGIAIPTDAPLDKATATETEIPTLVSIDLPPARTATNAPTLVVVPNVTKVPATASPTAQALNVKYDDTDFKFNYTGNWISQTSVNGAYQNTLHVSNTIGDSVQLSFVGQKIRIAYQAGLSLGTIAIKLDSADFTLDQSDTETIMSEWESPVLVLSSHTITITHISGGSINIDSIEVFGLSTPTPTAEFINVPTSTPIPSPAFTSTALNQ
jgi:hypothetical protein